MDDQISRFWDKYIEKTIEYGVKESLVMWCVRYVEQYIATNKLKRRSFMKQMISALSLSI